MFKLHSLLEQLNRPLPLTIATCSLLASFLGWWLDFKLLVDPAILTAFICGLPILAEALSSLWQKHRITSSLLISLAILASIYVREFFAAGEIALIMSIGEILEERTVAKAKQGIQRLLQLAPKQGRIISSSNDPGHLVPVEELQPQDLLRVLPGETLPVDGVIVVGNSSLNQAILTGESLPVDKGVGDPVFCGTLNGFGTLEIQVTKTGQDSSLQKLIQLVQTAENHKAPMQHTADKWAAWLVPTALFIAILTYGFTGDLTRAVTVLIVFCPCALALATPTAIMSAISQATKHGVLIKSGQALETMGSINCLAFDKTGTLTYGKLAVSDILPLDPQLTSTELLRIAASVEAHSEHPIGKAITAYAQTLQLALTTLEDVQVKPGQGISAQSEQGLIQCGNLTYMQTTALALTEEAAKTAETLRLQGKAVIFVAQSGKLLGMLSLSDMLRATAPDTIAQLQQLQIHSVLLTGDHAQTANYLANQLAISQVHAELLPAQKVECIRQLQTQYSVAMLGDGVNDAPALKAANVGIAMAGIGSDIAIEAADIALMGDDLSKLAYLKRLANYTLRTIHFNISLSMLINFGAIVLSILGHLNPIAGALVHNGGSILVILNAVWLYDHKF